MRLGAVLAGAVLGLAVPLGAFATVRITDDEGGYISQYTARYAAIRDSGEDVAIDGLCFSACTMVLGLVPQDRICITRKTVFAFHAAHWPAGSGHTGISPTHTQLMMALYPPRIRALITREGGLSDKIIVLTARDLSGLYRVCGETERRVSRN